MSELDETPLSEAEVLQFGPCVEAQVWNLSWLAEKRAPAAVAAGRPRLGRVFNDEGIGRAVLIRPCMSRGRRVRGLPPVYTPSMLEANGKVFAGRAMYFDHVPAGLKERLEESGRSVREIGGQVLEPWWDAEFVQEDDEVFGYQRGGVLSEIWATPYTRAIIGNNPNLLHTSISAWPTSGKVGPVPWAPSKRGMLIEGIRRSPQPSVDFVPRGGAGGRLLLAEGEDPDVSEWPEPGWGEDEVELVASLAESLWDGSYAVRTMDPKTPDFSKMKPEELRGWIEENAPHLAETLAAENSESPKPSRQRASLAESVTLEEVERHVSEAVERVKGDIPDLDKLREDLEEEFEDRLAERERQHELRTLAHQMISEAEGVPPSWKQDLRATYAFGDDGPSARLVLSEEDLKDADGKSLSEEDAICARVTSDLERVRERLAEARGHRKPRIVGEGGGDRRTRGNERVEEREETPYWREALVGIGLAESEEKAGEIYGIPKVED